MAVEGFIIAHEYFSTLPEMHPLHPFQPFDVTAIDGESHIVESTIPFVGAHYKAKSQEHIAVEPKRRIYKYRANERTAVHLRGFAYDMYNRIWFVPFVTTSLYVDFGIILRPTTRYFLIWNAYIDLDITCTAIDYTDDTQFQVNGPNGETPPWSLYRLGLREYEAIAYEDGLWQFRVTVTWTFDSPVFPSTLDGIFIGQRATLYPFAPLDNTMDEKLEWMTDVLESSNGNEQRIQVRQLPRQMIKYNAFIEDEARQANIEGLMYRWAKNAWGIPLWYEAVLYEGVITEGALQLNFDTTESHFKRGRAVCFWQDHNNYALNIIEDIDEFSDLVTFQLEMERGFTGRTFIMPVKSGWMDSPAKMTSTPDGQAIIKASFALAVPEDVEETYTPLTTLPENDDVGADLLPVLQKPSLVRRSQKIEMDGNNKVVDMQTGLFGIFSDTLHIYEVQDFRWREETKTDIWNFRLLLHYLKGKQKPIWIPTHRQDMTFVGVVGAAASDVAIIINETNLYELYGNLSDRTAIHFQYDDGEYIDHLITLWEQLPDNTIQITLDGQLGRDSDNENCIMSFLDKCRLVDDKVSIKWERQHIFESKVRFMRVKD